MKKMLILVSSLALATAAHAELITFDFEGTVGSDLETMGTSSVAGSGFSVGITAAANDGALNQTASGFGINHSGGGDDTDAFDDLAGAEFMTFSFTIPAGFQADFVSAEFDRLGATETGQLAFSGGSTINFDGSVVNDIIPVNEAITSGQSITLSHTAGNGFGLENIILDVTAIPEPSSMALFALGGIAALIRRKK